MPQAFPQGPTSGGNLPRYSHCRFLEFKVNAAFRRYIYEEIPAGQRKALHASAAEIYERDARKCNACGGGPFLRIPGREKPVCLNIQIKKNFITRFIYSNENI